MKKSFTYFMPVLGAILLFILILPYKLGFSPDSIAYLEVATNIKAGNGIVNNNGYVVNHWPPLFPLSLGFISYIADVGVVEAGAVLQVLFFFIYLLAAILVMKELRIKDKLIPFFFLSLLLSQATINYLGFLSEGLFLALLLLSFLSFIKWLHSDKLIYLTLCGFMCSLFFLTRYAGIAFLCCYFLYIIFFQKSYLTVKIKNIFVLASIFLIGILPWFIYQSSYEKPPVSREIGIHLFPFSKLQDFFTTIGYWFLGSKLAIASFLVLLIICLIRGSSLWKKILEFNGQKLPAVPLIYLFLFLYPLFLIVSISFFDFYTPMDNRILSPLLVFVIILLFLFFQYLLRRKEVKFVIVGISFLLLSFSSSLYPVVQGHYGSGHGYSKKMWMESETVSYLKLNPVENKIYSNGIELGKLHLQQNFELLPRRSDEEAVKKLIEEVESGKAEIVFFQEVNWRNYLISDVELKEFFDKDYFVQFEDGFLIKKF